jgi:NAD(P)-dependent dehydrogenase (short-subunit alcohol dehydrogenase family)
MCIDEYICSYQRYVQQFNTNLFGVINTTRAVLPHFRAKKSGVVVFIGSSGGIAGEPGAGAYCGSKHALEGAFSNPQALTLCHKYPHFCPLNAALEFLRCLFLSQLARNH